MNSQIDDLKNKLGQQERVIQNLRGYELKCDELENKIVLLTTEIDRLNEVVRNKLREIEEWRGRYT